MPNRRSTEQTKGQSDAGRTVSPVVTRSETSSRRGSQAVSPSDQARNQIDFQFLNFTHPSEAREAGARRKVRSHVTKQQHQREQQAAVNRRSRSYQQASPTEQEQALPQRSQAPAFPAAERSTSLPLSYASETPSASADPSSSSSPSPVASPTWPNQLDLVDVYPEEWLPYLGQIIEHYLSTRAIDIPDIEDTEARALLRTRFWPFVMTDAAPLHGVLLAAGTHYGNSYGPHSHPIDLLQLRGMAIRAINNALEDPTRATSDQLIAAVAKMASYEALYGDRQVFNTHMTGLTRMVTLRGGLPALGLGGLLERILLWIDSNASQIAGTRVYFDRKAFPSRAVHPRPDPRRFAGRALSETPS